MSDSLSTRSLLGGRAFPIPYVHHVGIRTSELDNCVRWYRDFFGCTLAWSLDKFSELTLQRLPGITRLVELAVGSVRFHLFEQTPLDSPGEPTPAVPSFQHVCFGASSPADLATWRDRWFELYRSGSYTFARDDLPTKIVTDMAGVQSCYLFDVNGLEFEFTYTPVGA